MSSEEYSNNEYVVENYIKPTYVACSINDESADLLGNFDDIKREKIRTGLFVESNNADLKKEERPCIERSIESEMPFAEYLVCDNDTPPNEKIFITKDQLSTLLRGASKTNRFVLYVTNLNFNTRKEDLEEFFSKVGELKSVRIPKNRSSGFAFVEMSDIKSFHNGLQMHNTVLQGSRIKVQLSEGGRKKSANKKNILKQKNRKLSEMRQETKAFTKSGKFYDKSLKEEKSKEILKRKRWRKKLHR